MKEYFINSTSENKENYENNDKIIINDEKIFNLNKLCRFDKKMSNLYFWMIHNSVNSRLRSEEELKKSEDTHLLKQQIPTKKECDSC